MNRLKRGAKIAANVLTIPLPLAWTHAVEPAFIATGGVAHQLLAGNVNGAKAELRRARNKFVQGPRAFLQNPVIKRLTTALKFKDSKAAALQKEIEMKEVIIRDLQEQIKSKERTARDLVAYIEVLEKEKKHAEAETKKIRANFWKSTMTGDPNRNVQLQSAIKHSMNMSSSLIESKDRIIQDYKALAKEILQEKKRVEELNEQLVRDKEELMETLRQRSEMLQIISNNSKLTTISNSSRNNKNRGKSNRKPLHQKQ